MKAAYTYARMGWRILPVEPGGKRPILKDWPKLASSDPATIAAWEAAHPNANIGAATGHGFWVLDVDPRNGGDDTLDALIAAHGPLPRTVQASTPSGGSHYLFRGANVTNTAGKIGAGIDTRGVGGQIVVAPSQTPQGVYTWVNQPWNTEIADPPDWILSLLGTRAAPAAVTVESLRGYFPAASPEVLEAAREALEQHGPGPARVNGEGGGQHTVQAAAILTHDFALTPDEAWPLLAEWNETRSPPWPEAELRVRLSRGEAYGKSAYGSRRTLDALEAAQKNLKDWESGERDAAEMWRVIERLRSFAALLTDPAQREVLERETAAATGITPRGLAFPKVRRAVAPVHAGQIEVTTRLHEVADRAETAIAQRVFQRAGILCEVVSHTQTVISDVRTARIQDLMSRSANFVRQDEKQGLVSMVPPLNVAEVLHSRRTHPGVRVIEAVTTAPIFLADGSILSERGYNEAARVYLEPSVTVDVPDEPTQAQAKDAVSKLTGLVCDFRFATPADHSSWVAAILTPLVKAATSNAPAPLFCVSAPSAGSGKSLLAELVSLIVTGQPAENRSYNPKDPGEWGKRLTSYVRMASPVSVFDNCNGSFGDPNLDRLITSTTWSDRILGASEAPPLPNVSTWIATGNNIEPVDDTVRRVLMIRIEVDVERPYERTGFAQPLLIEHVKERRSELLSAALTILRAYHVAGRPSQNLAAWGSFVSWSELVRGALVWAGCVDPYLTQKRASAELNEPENEVHDFWIRVVSDSDGTPQGVTQLANQRDAMAVLGMRDVLTATFLRRFVGRFVDRPRAGQRIRRGKDQAGALRYWVERIK